MRAAPQAGAPGALEAAMAAIEEGDFQAATAALLGASRLYYSGEPAMADAEYDGCLSAYEAAFGRAFRAPRLDRLATAGQAYPDLANFIDTELRGEEDLLRWYGANGRGSPLLGSPKYDGIAVVIEYGPEGRVLAARTRGDDGRGVDVTSMFAGERHWGAPVGAGARFGAKYEAVMTWDALAALNEETGKAYKNPRNTVAGIFASDSRRERRRFVTLAPLDVEYEGMPRGRFDRIEAMEDLLQDGNFLANGMHATPWWWETLFDAADARDFLSRVERWRATPAGAAGGCEYMIDGAVLELGAEGDIARLGGRCQEPRWVAKYKFPAAVGQTRAVSLDWDVGATGRATPVVNFEPIVMNGNTYSRTSIANMARFDQLRLCPGTPLRFELRGEVLGWLDRSGPDPEGAVPFPDPEGATYTYNDDGQRVFALVEPPLAERCVRMIGKCGIRGVKEKSISKLVEAGLVRRLADLWTLDSNEVAGVEGFGPQSAALLVDAVNAKKAEGLWDWELLASLGIAGIGRTVAKGALRVQTLQEMAEAYVADAAKASAYLALDEAATDVGPGRAMTMLAGLAAHWDDVVAISEAVEIRQTMGAAAPSAPAAGAPLTIVVTGELEGWDPREKFERLLEEMGHKVTGAVSKKTDFLVTNFPNSNTNKLKRARELGVPVLSEREAIERLGIGRPAGREAEEVGLGDL